MVVEERFEESTSFMRPREGGFAPKGWLHQSELFKRIHSCELCKALDTIIEFEKKRTHTQNERMC